MWLPSILPHLNKYRLSSAIFLQKSLNVSSKALLKSKPKPVLKSPISRPTIEIWDGIKISEISKLTNRPVGIIVSSINAGLFNQRRVNASSVIEDRNLLITLVSLLGYRTKFISKNTTKKKLNTETVDAKPRPPADRSECVPRPPVVAIMGHVDHGKTTLLDALRSSRIVDGEFGGITQHLSAFSLSIKEAVATQSSSSSSLLSSSSSCTPFTDGVITFIDTPGHAAFSAMRARGASMTDIVLLVVAADDGVMPQTVESIKYARESNAQILVAVNKVDKYDANVEHVLQGLATYGVVTEALGGDVQAVEVSALKRLNLISLLEAITAQAEVMQLVAEDKGPAEAVVLESRTEHGIGKVATCLVTRGQIRQGSTSGPLVAGESVGHTRILRNDRDVKVDSVGPGFMATVAGWKTLPPVGSVVLELASDAEADSVIRHRRQLRLTQKSEVDKVAIDKKMANYRTEYQAYLQKRGKMDLASARRFAKEYRKARTGLALLVEHTDDDVPSLPLVIKTDVEGSLEAIKDMLHSCPTEQCRLQIAASGVGPVTPADVELAMAIGAEILTFNVGALSEAESVLQETGLSVHSHNIIYRLAEDVQSLITQRLPMIDVEEIIGEATILQTFEVTIARGKRRQKVAVGGCRCTKGNIISKPGVFFRVLRAGQCTKHPPIGDDGSEVNYIVLVDRAECHSLRVGPKDVDTVRRDVECGLILHLPTNGVTATSADTSEAFFFSDWNSGDRIYCYRINQQSQTLNWHIDSHNTT